MGSPKALLLSREIRYDLPFGLFCIASSLKKNDIDIVFSSWDHGEIKNKIRHYEPQIIIITLYDSTLSDTIKLIKFLRGATKAFISVGGPMPTLYPKEALFHSGADIAIRGEAENILPRLIKSITDNNTALETIPGIIVKSGDKIAADTTQANNLLSQDELNNMDLDYNIIVDGYFDENFFNLSQGIRFTSSRGCPYSCIFCSHIHGKQFRAMGAGKIISELKKIDSAITNKEKIELAKALKINESNFEKSAEKIIIMRKIIFNDDDFFIDRERALEFFEKASKDDVILKRFWFIFQAGIKSFIKNGIVDNELISAIKKVNTIMLQVGTDSFTTSELKNMSKGYTFDDIRKVISAFENNKIANLHYLILSNLFTTPGNIIDNLKNIVELKTRFKFFNILSVNKWIIPYCGTPAQTLAASRGYGKQLSGRVFRLRAHPDLDFTYYDKLNAADIRVVKFIDRLNQKEIEENDINKINKIISQVPR